MGINDSRKRWSTECKLMARGERGKRRDQRSIAAGIPTVETMVRRAESPNQFSLCNIRVARATWLSL